MPGAGALLIASPATLTNPTYPGVTAGNTLTANSNRFRMEHSAPTIGTIYGGRHILSATQTLNDHVIVFAAGVANSNNRATTVTSLTIADGGMVAIFDSLGNYRRWNVFSGGLSNSVNAPVVSPVRPHAIDLSCTSSMQEQSATPPNLSNIVALEFHARAATTSSISWRLSDIYSISKTNPIRIVGGTIGTPANFNDLIDYQTATTRLFFLGDSSSDSKVYTSLAPISLDADVMVDQGSTLIYPVNAENSITDPRYHVTDIGFRVNVPASGSINVSGLQVKSGTQNIVGAQSLGAGASAVLSALTQTSINTLTLSAGTFQGTFLGFNAIELDGATLSNVSFSSGNTLTISSLGAETDITITDVPTINFDLAPGNHSDFIAALEPGQIFSITQGAGTYDLSGLTGGAVENEVRFDNTGGGAVVVVLGPNIEAIADPSPTAGTITVQFPASEILLTGIPNVSGALVGVVNLSTMVLSYPTVSAGAATIPTDPATNYLIAVDAPGYQLQRVVLSGATPAFECSLENNRDLYEAGIDISANLLFNYSTFEVTFVWAEGVVFNNANIYRTIEDYLATEEGVFFPNPPRPIRVPGRNFLFFPYDAVAEAVNPVRVRPHPANMGNPRITDVVVILEGAENPQTDIFDFSLAGGKTIFYQTDSTVASVAVSGGLSPADREVIDAIATATADLPELIEDESGKRFTAKALEQAPAPAGGGGGLGPEDIERLERIEQQLTADIRKGATRYKRLLPGTETVILDQDVVYSPETGFTLTQHVEPPP